MTTTNTRLYRYCGKCGKQTWWMTIVEENEEPSLKEDILYQSVVIVCEDCGAFALTSVPVPVDESWL